MKKELISQYGAALSMLSEAIEYCPEKIWDNAADNIAYWQLVYHALYFTDLYLAENPHSFIRWHKHRSDYQKLGRLPVNLAVLPKGNYLKIDMLDYTAVIMQALEHKINQVSLEEPSGFEWLVMNKLELHMYNIRHLQHHTGQLIERLHQHGVSGINWISQTYEDDP